MRFLVRIALIVSVMCCGATPGRAQGTPADYARANALREGYESTAVDIAGAPTAIGRTHRFWYRKSIRGGDQFIVIDADTQQKQPAFNHEQIARSLSQLTGSRINGLKLPFNTIAFADDGASFTANVEGAPYRCSVAESTCRKLDPGARAGAGRGVGRR